MFLAKARMDVLFLKNTAMGIIVGVGLIIEAYNDIFVK